LAEKEKKEAIYRGYIHITKGKAGKKGEKIEDANQKGETE